MIERLSRHHPASLRRRAAFYAALVVTVALGTTYLVLGRIVQGGFSDLERTKARRNIERVSNTIANEAEMLDAKLAAWLASGPIAEAASIEGDCRLDGLGCFDDVVVNRDVLRMLGVDALVLTDGAGRIVPRLCVGCEGWDVQRVEQDLAAVLTPAWESGTARGLVWLGGVPALVAAARADALRTGGERSPLLVFVRWFHGDALAQAQRMTQLDIRLSRVDAGGELPAFEQSSTRWQARTFQTLQGPDGRPVAVLEVRFPREVYAYARETMRLIAVGLILTGLLFGVICVVGLRALVLDRLGRLDADVEAITRSTDRSRRVGGLGRDELGSLAARINDMLAALDRNQGELEERARQLALARDDAEAASRAKSDFLANMSHEIRTPMTAILGFADLLVAPDQTPQQRLDCVHTIRRNGEHLLTVINDILDLSKIEAGRMSVERIACDPVAVVREVVELLLVRATGKGIDLGVEVHPDVPRRVTTDPTRLRQILLNLAGNAIKFTSSGGVRIILGPALRDGRYLLRFDVLDTGIGLTPEQIAGLFKPFTQADQSTTRCFGGTGLGLTISKKLARALDGDISVESVPGMGSTFTLVLDPGDAAWEREPDLQSEPVRIDVAGVRPAPARDAEPLSTPIRVLLAEDGPDNQRLITFHLKRSGAQVDVVGDGQAAVDATLAARDRGEPYDLVLMDMLMPVLDGYKATGALRERGYTGRIVALTANAMSGDRSKCLSAGCDDYLTKPVNPKELRDLLASATPPGRRERGTGDRARTAA